MTNDHPSAARRHGLVLLALALLLGLGGCATAGERLNQQAASSTSAAPSVTPTASTAQLALTPATGAVDVPPDQPVVVAVTRGQLRSVELSGPTGAVPGTMSADLATWTSSAPLALGTAYALSALAVDPFGLEQRASSSFTTLTPTEVVRARVSPLEGETVGVGMPVVLYFTEPVDERAAVEARLSVTSTPAVEGAWHWISDSELHWRPQDLWPAGTDVTVDIPLTGVRAGETLWGDQDRTISFSITDVATTSTVDLAAKTLTVFQDAVPVKTIPITAGKPGWETRNGTKVILEKHREIVMDGDSVGIDPGDPEYYRLDVDYALRVTWSGEFLHAAPWSVGQQGEALVSHGCVGMSTADAAWLFDLTTRGDVVTVTNSPRALEKGNGYTDWNYPWEEWLAGSALFGLPTPTPAAP